MVGFHKYMICEVCGYLLISKINFWLSENSLLGNYLNKNLSLVEFWMRFNSAIESQRHTELLTDRITKISMDFG